MSLESRMKMRKVALKDGRRPPSRVGVPSSDFQKQRMKEVHSGKTDSEITKLRRRLSARRGHNNYFWRGGITNLALRIRTCFKYRQWRSDVFTRDNFTCQFCGQRGGELNADHIQSFSSVIKDNKIKTLEDALLCEELWNINNGRTLCHKCHKTTDNYGRKARA